MTEEEYKNIEPQAKTESEAKYKRRREEKKSAFKSVIAIIQVIIVIIAIYLLCSSNGAVIITDFYASIYENDYENNPYIQMVQTMKPFDNGTTYYQAFSKSFDSSKWQYFKAEGKRVVQITSRYNDINDVMITQFIITPTDKKGEFSIEPYAMRVSDKNLSKYEMSIVLTAVFQDDVMEALGQLFLYGNLPY